MRADARRNRRRLLDAAIELILEIGGEPSRDAVAQRAGVGIATLYRHFPDRQTLLRAVVLDVLDRTIDQANLRSPSRHRWRGVAPLHARRHRQRPRRGQHRPPAARHPDWPDRRAAAQDVLDRLIDVARRDGAIDDDVTATDIALATIRFCRPLAIGLDPTDERAIAHRQLDSYLDGLAPTRVVASSPPRIGSET
jgi:AcrR family transcriptional regulator